MVSVGPQPVFVITQPFAGNPFHQLTDEWRVGLFDCCNDVGQCCYAHWCWCCFVGSLAGKINESTASCCCVPYALAVYRMKVRSVLRIKGDSCNDYCAIMCCPCCVGLQMRNELTSRGLA